MTIIETETWTEMRERLLNANPDLTPDQLEAVRRVGAKRRHLARVSQAEEKIRAVLDGAMVVEHASNDVGRLAAWHFLDQALVSALDCVGTPGSACGSAPPGIFRGHPHERATKAAWVEAMVRVGARVANGVPRHGSGRRVIIGSDNIVEYKLTVENPGTVAVVHVDSIDTVAKWSDPVIVEHMLAEVTRRDAEALDQWLWTSTYRESPMPEPPPADLCAEHERLVMVRRAPPPSDE